MVRMVFDDGNTLCELEYENGVIKAIRFRQSTTEPFQEMKFCSLDSDGLPYDYTIFDMAQQT